MFILSALNVEECAILTLILLMIVDGAISLFARLRIEDYAKLTLPLLRIEDDAILIV